ncbi:MAG: 3'-5' exonuclease [Solirubrobacteraceae bacterium]
MLARTTNLLRTVALACAALGVKIAAPEPVFEPYGARGALEAYLRLCAEPQQAQPDDVVLVCRTPSRGLPFETEEQVAELLRGGLTFTESLAGLRASESQRAMFGCEENQLPHRRALEVSEQERAAGEGLEAERRLAYVAFTRAQEKLVVHTTETAASRFLTEAGLQPARPYGPRAADLLVSTQQAADSELDASIMRRARNPTTVVRELKRTQKPDPRRMKRKTRPK